MKFYGDIDLNLNLLKNIAFEKVTDFPSDPVIGQTVFVGRKLYFCAQMDLDQPIWIPLTNEIDSLVYDQVTPAATWDIVHELDDNTISIQIFDADGLAIFPDSIDTSVTGHVMVNFGVAVAGKAVIIHRILGLVDINPAVIGGPPPTTLAGYGIVDAVSTEMLDAANGVPTLDANSKIHISQLPSLVITETFIVQNEQEMLVLVAERGDIAIRTDLNKTFVLASDNPTVVGSWTELLSPTADVTSVNGMIGAVTVTTITGNAGTATKLATARNINLTGDVTGTIAFDGSADVNIATLLKGDVVQAKTFTGNVEVDYTLGSYVAATVTGATVLSLTGVPDATRAYGLTLELTNAGTNISWPGSVAWVGTAPTLRASGISMVTLITRNGGTTWLGSAA